MAKDAIKEQFCEQSESPPNPDEEDEDLDNGDEEDDDDDYTGGLPFITNHFEGCLNSLFIARHIFGRTGRRTFEGAERGPG